MKMRRNNTILGTLLTRWLHLLLPATVLAWPFGAGGCQRTEFGSVGGAHLNRARTFGSLEDYGIYASAVSSDDATGIDFRIDQGINVTVGTQYQVNAFAPDDKSFRGFLFRLENPDDASDMDMTTSFSVSSNFSDTVQLAANVCFPLNVGGVTHISNSDKKQAAAWLQLDDPVEGLRLGMTMVVRNGNGVSEWYFSEYTVNARLSVDVPNAPVVAPVGDPQTSSPSVAPTTSSLSTKPMPATSFPSIAPKTSNPSPDPTFASPAPSGAASKNISSSKNSAVPSAAPSKSGPITTPAPSVAPSKSIKTPLPSIAPSKSSSKNNSPTTDPTPFPTVYFPPTPSPKTKPTFDPTTKTSATPSTTLNHTSAPTSMEPTNSDASSSPSATTSTPTAIETSATTTTTTTSSSGGSSSSSSSGSSAPTAVETKTRSPPADETSAAPSDPTKAAPQIMARPRSSSAAANSCLTLASVAVLGGLLVLG